METVDRSEITLHKWLDNVTECIWLAVVFIIPLYFNPFALYAFYFAKSIVFILLVCILLGLVSAQWIIVGGQLKFKGSWSHLIKDYPLQMAAIILGIIWIISTLFSILPYKSIWGNLAGTLGLLTNIAWIMYFLVISLKLKNRGQIYRIFYTLLISSGLVALVGILQYIDPHVLPWFKFSGRVFSTDGNPLSLSAFLAMTVPLTLAMTINTWYGPSSKKRRLIIFGGLLVLFVLQMVCLALAQYSITVLQFIIGIFVFFALIGFFMQKKLTIALSMAFLVVLCIIAVLLLGPMMSSNNSGNTAVNQNTEISTAEQVGLPTLSIRVDTWKSAADLIIQSPEIPYSNDSFHWLRRVIGYGPETFIAASQTVFPDKLKAQYTFDDLVISQPENHYLYLGVTIGILGLAAFMCILILFFIISFKTLVRSKDLEPIVLVSAFIAAIVQYCVHILFNPSVINPELVLWLVLGMTAALTRIDKETRGKDSQLSVIASHKDNIVQVAQPVRLSASILVIIVFISIGIFLTLPPLLANMKIKSGLNTSSKDKIAALAYYEEATIIEPHQSYYFNFLSNTAFIIAQATNDAEVKAQYLNKSEAASLKAIEQEPPMAIWYYRLADNDVSRAMNGDETKMQDALSLYEKADTAFPGNAVILNKWGFALTLKGDCKKAEEILRNSELSDPAWIQTSYFKGLLKASMGDMNGASNLLLASSKQQVIDLKYFINFCSLAAKYGKAPLIRDSLVERIADTGGDWLSYAFLGTADIYSGSHYAAISAFKRSAEIVPDEYRFFLAGAVKAMFSNSSYSSLERK